MKKFLKWFFVLLTFLFILGGILTFFSVGEENDVAKNEQLKQTKSNGVKESKKEPLFQAESYSRISEKELVKIRGKQEKIDKWTYTSPSEQKYKFTSYWYDNGNTEFIFADKKLIAMNTEMKKAYKQTDYANFSGHTQYSNFLALYEIIPSDRMEVAANSPDAVRLERVSEKIDEVWAVGTTLKIRYDSRYFE